MGAPEVDDFLSARESFGCVHGDGAGDAAASVLGDFEDEFGAVVFDDEGVEDGRGVSIEADIDDGAHHLGDVAFFVARHGGVSVSVG